MEIRFIFFLHIIVYHAFATVLGMNDNRNQKKLAKIHFNPACVILVYWNLEYLYIFIKLVLWFLRHGFCKYRNCFLDSKYPYSVVFIMYTHKTKSKSKYIHLNADSTDPFFCCKFYFTIWHVSYFKHSIMSSIYFWCGCFLRNKNIDYEMHKSKIWIFHFNLQSIKI